MGQTIQQKEVKMNLLRTIEIPSSVVSSEQFTKDLEKLTVGVILSEPSTNTKELLIEVNDNYDYIHTLEKVGIENVQIIERMYRRMGNPPGSLGSLLTYIEVCKEVHKPKSSKYNDFLKQFQEAEGEGK